MAKEENIDDIEAELLEYGDRPPPRRAWIDVAHRLHDAHKRELSELENSRKAFAALKGLFDNDLLPNKSAICPPNIFDGGFSPENELCQGCKSETKKKCMALYNARQVLKLSACTQPVSDCNILKKALDRCYEALEFVTRPRVELSPDPISEILAMRDECRNALMAAKAAERGSE